MGLAGSLQHDEAHIWQMKLDNPIWDGFSSVLNDEERARSARFRTLKLQQHFSRCRSALRLILARYVNRAASQLEFRYGEFGKPELLGHRLQFNLTHSGEHALIAVSSHVLGVDIEFMGKQNVDLPGLIDVVCHPDEKSELALLGEGEQTRRFYTLWSQKEAYCKMLGVGLQQTLAGVRFSATDNAAVMEVHAEGRRHAAPYFVHQLQFRDDYSACLCLPLQQVRIGYFNA